MRFSLGLLAGLCLLAAPAVLALSDGPAVPSPYGAVSELERQDRRLAVISDRILAANAELCEERMPVTGMVLHSRDQYSTLPSPDPFAAGPLAVASVIQGGPADRASLRAGDIIVAIADTPVATLVPTPGKQLREAAFDLVAANQFGQVPLTIRRGDSDIAITVNAPMGCRALVEVRNESGTNARTDGRIIQLTLDYMARLSDEEVAVSVAHELSHGILRHRARKDAAGIVVEGSARYSARNMPINRVAEIEADRLSLHLLANARYDPAAAAAWWRRRAAETGPRSPLRQSIYPSHAERAALLEEEMRRYLPSRRGPSWPGHLLDLRTRSFDD